MRKNNYKMSFNKFVFLNKFGDFFYYNYLITRLFKINLSLINFLVFISIINFNYFTFFQLKNLGEHRKIFYIYKGLRNNYFFYYNIIFMLKDAAFFNRNVEVIFIIL